jgi:hypothetical protein
MRQQASRRQSLFAFRSACKKLPVFMSEKFGFLPKEKNMSQDVEEECVATSRSKRDELMGAWGKLRNKEVHNSFLSAKYC